jgi:cation transport regulator ChaB
MSRWKESVYREVRDEDVEMKRRKEEEGREEDGREEKDSYVGWASVEESRRML